MVFPKFLRRQRQHAHRPPAEPTRQLPTVITIRRRQQNTQVAGNHRGLQEDSLTNSSERELEENAPNQHPVASVKAQVVLKEDRICNMVEATGDKVVGSMELIALTILALASILPAVVLWAVLVLVALHSLEWEHFWKFALILVAALLGMGAWMTSWTLHWIRRRRLPKQLVGLLSLQQTSATASCTDISDLADN